MKALVLFVWMGFLAAAFLSSLRRCRLNIIFFLFLPFDFPLFTILSPPDSELGQLLSLWILSGLRIICGNWHVDGFEILRLMLVFCGLHFWPLDLYPTLYQWATWWDLRSTCAAFLNRMADINLHILILIFCIFPSAYNGFWEN